MLEYPKDINFKYSWRKYQQRVLDDLRNHLADEHLHIIAPPGSGKTVLGLQVAIQLNKPTLILVPTIAIRNQWIQRFCELFLQTSTIPEWISKDIRNPKFLTVATYQGLHAACSYPKKQKADNELKTEGGSKTKITNTNLENTLKKLKKLKTKTVIIDEAHHLKNEWWQTLITIKEKLSPTIVGLTATPPYDSTAREWQRYVDLNGPVDTEISVPELVLEGDLCPHQDYIHFSYPTNQENKILLEFRENINSLFHEIRNDEVIIKAIQNHPIWLNPTENLEWIYDNLSFYSACIIFLNSNGIEISETHLEIIGDKKIQIPQLDYEWMQFLLDFYLYKENKAFLGLEEHQKLLENKLKRYGVVEKRKINFFHNRRISNILSSSISKLNGIKEIVDFEYSQLGKDLRMVILSDFIRIDYLVNTSKNDLELNKMGVMPIFEKLRRDNKYNLEIAVLTGSIIIIPEKAFSAFEAKATKYGITQISYSSLSFDPNYILIYQTELLKHDIVNLITQIFQEGEIEVLIGTKSLLGEGWDAPAINSLILASFVGSFVLSNQMRGRAIRTQYGNNSKTGNIWHLVCIDPFSTDGGDDFALLKRRFRSFVGISFGKEPTIENGIGRLNLPTNMFSKDELEKHNKEMHSFAAQRQNLKQAWITALKKGVSLVEEIKIPFSEKRDYKSTKAMYYKKTIKNSIITLLLTLVGYGLDSLLGILRNARGIKSFNDFYLFLGIFGIIGMLKYGRRAAKTFRLYIKYRDITKDIQHIGDALLASLKNEKIIQTEANQLSVETSIDDWGSIYCRLIGGTPYEASTFINAIREIINPIDNPRYIITRENRSILLVNQIDYHAVPSILGQNKKMSVHFKEQWKLLVGNCKLIFTRTIEGRKLLLQARMKSLSNTIHQKTEYINKWK